MRVILASASPARLKTLQNAGVHPEVIVSDVDERALVAQTEAEHGPLTPAEQALLLARAKCEAVARIVDESEPDDEVIVIGCDSVFEFEGKPYGRPPSPEIAVERIKKMSGRSGVLHTGHWVAIVGAMIDRSTGAVGSTIVNFAEMHDVEIDAYVASGEPMNVAGSFTVDGLGGPYVESVEGDYHNVVGISLPLVRKLLLQLGFPWHWLRNH